MATYDNPARTLELLDMLEALGFPDSAFAILHHYKSPEKIARHRAYCSMLLEEENGRFRTNTNRLVQRRLELVLLFCEQGKLTCRSHALFEHLAHAALEEFPHDSRALLEQYHENQRTEGAA